MSGVLRQSTTTTVILGPFLDSTDGVTPETALSIPSGSVQISKNGGTFGAKAESTACAHQTGGLYSCIFNNADTNTRGNFLVSVQVAGALPVWDRFVIYNADGYDFLFSTSNLFALATTISGKIDTAQADLDIITGANGVTLASTQANYAPATAAALSTLTSNVAIIDGIVDAILVDTDATLDDKIDALTTALATVNGIVTSIKGKTDSLQFSGTGRVHANVGTVNDYAILGNGTSTPFYSTG
jgi:hypothetical protein